MVIPQVPKLRARCDSPGLEVGIWSTTAADDEVICTIRGLDEFTGVSVEKSMSIFFFLV